MAAIQLANDLQDGDVIRAGQILTVPASQQWEGELPYWIVHVVQRGETLTGIAQTFGVTVRDILRVNTIADPEQISPAQLIIIPLESVRVTATPTRRPTSTPTRVSPLSSPSPRPATPRLSPTPVPPTVPSNIAAWPLTIVTLINQKRAAHGLPPYTVAPELMRAAQVHADDCAARGWCGHVGSDGSDVRIREIRAGYTPTWCSEAWAWYPTPAIAVDFWYNETPPNDVHRRDLLSTNYAEIGVGVAPIGNNYCFIVNYGKR